MSLAPDRLTSGKSALPRRSPSFVVLICFVTIVFDGYDLIVYGTTIPPILAHQEWGVTPEQAGAIGSYSLVGMLIGALTVGAITDILGRRKIMLISITWFSAAMGLSALSTSPEMLGVLRFVAGLGLGGVVPTSIALTVEYSPSNRRQLNNAMMYCGYFVGGILTALTGLLLLPHVDFRAMYAIGALPLLVVLPVAWRYLPESVAFLVARGRHDEARTLADQYGLAVDDVVPSPAENEEGADRLAGIRTLFQRTYLPATVLFGAASFCGLLLVYGMNTWLPNIMTTAGFELGSSLLFVLALNIGGIVGVIAASRLADRIGVKPVTVGAFLAATLSILLLSAGFPLALLIVCVAAAGFGTGTQILVNGFVAVHFPASSRATALGWSLGVGRIGAILGPILGGLVAGSALGYQWNFYLFAMFALLGAVLIAAVPHVRRAAEAPEPLTSQGRQAQRSR
jgi:MFS transporter, AAHS family, benzoate transport protein